MSRQAISTGTSANDGTGDTLRSAGQKINQNFAELYAFLGGGDSSVVSSGIYLEDSALVFEGSATDDYETRLGVVNPTADRQVLIPNSNGIIVLDVATQTLTNKTLTSPTIQTQINGAGGGEIIKLSDAGASAVNEITVHNAVSGSPVQITATGNDPNINMRLDAKGTGSVRVKKLAIAPAASMTSSGWADSASGYIIFDAGTGIAVSLGNGTTVGETKMFTNKNTGVATVTPTNFAQGTSFALAQYDGCTAIWDGSDWYLVGNQGEITIA